MDMVGRGGKSVATWQPSCQKVFKNQDLAESLWILFPHFLTSKQLGGSIKGILRKWDIFLINFFIISQICNET